MDTKNLYDSTVSIIDGDIGGSSSYHDRQEDNSSDVDIVRESSIEKEIVMQTELDVACSSERLVNLNILMMHVAERASKLEAIASDNTMKEESPAVSTRELLEFDFLYEIFDSEVMELGDLIATLQKEILNAREMVSSGKHMEKSLAVILERRLDDTEKSLKQSQEDVSDFRSQSANLRRILSCSRNEENSQEDKDGYDPKNGIFLHDNAKIKMQTSEQQRHILRMLEKSLATEMDLEKKLIESKQIEEELKSRLHSSAEEVISLKEQATTLLERLFEADNTAEVLAGISREQMGRLQLSQFSLNGAAQREAELKCRIESSESPTSKDTAEIAALRERLFLVEHRAESAEVKCKMWEETNATLKEEVKYVRHDYCNLAEMVETLKKQLEEADIQLEQAAASVDASQEKQAMLYSSISDMQTVIDGLKSKVVKAETQADNAEDKWIMLSESNAELNDELNLLRGRLECLEASAQQAEEAKAATAKDINVRTKVIMDLVMRLAIERERLHKKVSSVMKENKFLVENVQETNKDKSLDTSDHVGKGNEQKEVREVKSSISTEELQKPSRDAWEGQSTPLSPTDVESKLETVRTLDAGQLKLKHIFIAIIVLALSGLVFYLFNMENRLF